MTKEKSFRHAVKWAYVMQGSEQGLNALFTFLFAAILGPKDFGTVAMGMAYILFVKLILEQGFLPALVQKRDLQKEHLDSVFFLNLSLSIVLMLASIGMSKWWARVNHLPILAPVISALSLILVLEGLTIVQKAVLERDLDFKSFSIRSIIANLVGGAVGLGMAWKGYGVWSLVGKQLSTDFLGFIVLWRLSHWRPGLSFSVKAIRDLLSYSLGSFTGNLGVWLNGQIDTLIIGLFFGPVSVGLYRLAGRIPTIILAGTTSSLQAAAFPQFCRIQENFAELRENVLSCFRMGGVLSIPLLAGVAVLSKPILSILGPKWADASTAMTIVCFAAMFQPIALFTAPLLQSLSKTHFLAAIEWGNAALLATSISIAGLLLRGQDVQHQVTGIAATRLITTVCIFMPFLVWMFRRFAGIRFSSMVQTLGSSFVAAAAVVLADAGVMALSSGRALRLWESLSVEVFCGAAIGLAVLIYLDATVRAVAGKVLRKATPSEFLPARFKKAAFQPGEITATRDLSE
jgi:PST family polysaccharide transporter